MAEIYTKPTTDIAWAEGFAADVDEPSTPEKETGWVYNQAHPADYENWLRQQTSRHITHANNVAIRHFDNIASAIDTLDPGTPFYLRESLEALGASATTVLDVNPADVSGVAHDGRFLYVIDSNYRLLKRDTTENVTVWSDASTIVNTAGSPVKVHTDGYHVAVIFSRDGSGDHDVYIFECGDGTLAHSEALTNTSGFSYRGYDIHCASDPTSGEHTVFWTDGHDINYYSLTPPSTVGTGLWKTLAGYPLALASAPGMLVCVEAENTTNEGTMTLRRYKFSATEYGTAPVINNSGDSSVAQICTDGVYCYTACNNTFGVTDPQYIECFSMYDPLAPLVWRSPDTGFGVSFVNKICVDDRFLYWKDITGELYLLDKTTGNNALCLEFEVGAHEVNDFDIDGVHMFIAFEGTTVIRYSTQRRAGLWVTVDPDPVTPADYADAGTNRVPFNKLALPQARF